MILCNNASHPFDLATVIKSSEAIHSEINLENLPRTVLQIILENSGAQKGCLILQKDKQFFVEAIENSGSNNYTIAQSITVGECTDIPQQIINYVIKNQKSLIIENAVDSIYKDDIYIQKHQCKSILCVPILFQSNIGIFYLEDNLITNAFTPSKLEFIKIFISQAAIAIKNARLFASEQEKTRILQFRSEIDSTLAKSHDLQQMLQQCTEIIVSYLNVGFARIWTCDRNQKQLQLQASAGIYTHIDGAHSRIPVGKLKIGLIAQERKPHITNSVQTDAISDKEWAIREGMIAFAGYPLIADGEIMGVVAMFSQQKLDQNTLELLSFIVGEIAIAIKRKNTEQALKQQEEQYRSIFETVNDGLSIFNLETGKAVAVNPTWCQMYGYSSEEFLTLNASEYIHQDSLYLFGEFIDSVKAGKEFYAQGICIHKNGTLFDVEVKATFYIYNNKPHALTITRDISDFCEELRLRKRAETILQQRTQELEQTLVKLKSTQSQLIQTEKISQLGQLVAGVAHEVNNPVSFVSGNLSHAEGYIRDLINLLNLYQQEFPHPGDIIESEIAEIDLEYLIEDLPAMVSSMKLGADRIKDIMLSLRNYSRTSSDEKKAVNLREGIDTTLMILSHRLKAKPERPAIQIVKNYTDLPLVNCDRGQINQVFMNLISNAIDALEESNQGTSYKEIEQNPNIITITTAALDNWVTITIADNGTGIPTQVKQKLFDAFFTTKPESKGTGLGLSISYQIITEKHGGTLECISSPGSGAKFVMRIPV
ncbi:GAF domain-containing protein [Rivularia sp. UHCC 0363]|uniref:GAF domain-containing protein n=1 Tax=Rivularia sp. UHCC 0363 TaxID=3110244 RepID=UPI002B2169A7|nr:GAF domain-containing protein [Rivularia sp. UHCC 0363]MEA5597211.1 GAF domain-containing protein [Rivularia sp. UHCC 0363]